MALFGLLNSFTIELLFICLSVCYFIYYKLQKKYNYFNKFSIPYVKPTSYLWGSVKELFMLKVTFGEISIDLYNQLKKHGTGGYFTLWRPTIMVCQPEEVRKFLVKDFGSFHDHGLDIDEKTNPLDGNLFSLSGKKWKILRNKLTPTFTSGKLKWMFEPMHECGQNLVEFLHTLPEHEDLQIKDIFARYTTDVIASCAFGIDASAIKDPDCEFRRMAKRIFTPTKWQIFKGICMFMAPKLFLKLKIKTQPKEIEDFFFSITKQAFDQRLKSGEKRRDFLQLLLELREKGSIDIKDEILDENDKAELAIQEITAKDDCKLEFTDELLTAQSFVFFLGGFENAASVMAFTCYCLSKNPDIQTRVYNEIIEVKEKHGGITYDALQEMVILNACISETMRLYPPGDSLFRKCNKKYRLSNGGTVDEGVSIVIPTYAIHRDPEHFENPLEFRPERFLNGQHPKPGTYLPFGDGPRVCIAQRFAILEAKLGLAQVLEKYEMLQSSKNIEPIRFDPLKIMTPIGGLWVQLKKRPFN